MLVQNAPRGRLLNIAFNAAKLDSFVIGTGEMESLQIRRRPHNTGHVRGTN